MTKNKVIKLQDEYIRFLERKCFQLGTKTSYSQPGLKHNRSGRILKVKVLNEKTKLEKENDETCVEATRFFFSMLDPYFDKNDMVGRDYVYDVFQEVIATGLV